MSVIDSTPFIVYRGNRIDGREEHTAGDLYEKWAADEYASDEDYGGWPLERRVGGWLSSWAVLDSPDEQMMLTEYIADRRLAERSAS